jgi:hypothetical protein
VGGADGETPADAERRYLTTQVAQLRIELARSEAEIEQLEGMPGCSSSDPPHTANVLSMEVREHALQDACGDRAEPFAAQL